MAYWVTGKLPTLPGAKRTRRYHRTKNEAERRIAKRAKRDRSVERGDWYIDGPCYEDRCTRRQIVR